MKTILIDGSMGEGGGQVLRTSLSLSLVTGRPFVIENIRAGRRRPGMARQHLASVKAAAGVASARVEGAQINSTRLEFLPQAVRPGEYSFDVGSAGSATLVFQTVLPALMLAGGASFVEVSGGTHNAWAPPFDFLKKTFLPCLERMGPKVAPELVRHGFYPAGGGKFTARVEPVQKLEPLVIEGGLDIIETRARAVVSALPEKIAHRELAVVKKLLNWHPRDLFVERVAHPMGPGNVIHIEARCRQLTEVVTAFGRKGLPAEEVARKAADEFLAYQRHGAPVGRNLADQLLIPLALARKGSFLTGPPTLHTRTNIEVIRMFLDVRLTCERVEEDVWRIAVG